MTDRIQTWEKRPGGWRVTISEPPPHQPDLSQYMNATQSLSNLQGVGMSGSGVCPSCGWTCGWNQVQGPLFGVFGSYL